MDTENKNIIIEPVKEFVKYMRKKIKSKGMMKKDVLYLADVPLRYGYKLLLGEKTTKQRDIIIRICYASKFTEQELQEALKLYEMPMLYKRILRDKYILEFFNTKKYDIESFNEYLTNKNVSPLKGCGE